jgi:hypothetical protein
MAGRQYTSHRAKTFDAASDLSLAAKRYCFVKKTAVNYGVDLCGADERAIGVLTVGAEEGKGATVALVGGGGSVMLKAGAAITAGQKLKSDASGRAVPVLSGGQPFFAIALETVTNADEYIEALFQTGSTLVASPSASKSPSASQSPSASKSPSASASASS